ncbi:serine/threonine-protein kinase [Krasilnikovia cinnamomea]|uniref:non-specific serine/threonine protein kinase n=1 Tax=Krasilnikovia cinnamomea TaxID=349313 RepID=A0A4Q7ZNB8_9ACTN|nr:protein kinase [Krasilnikovia cinnamomea]RZU51855.1 serine/threonine-protein kinase [Krasilnikovia cinnamomea]
MGWVARGGRQDTGHIGGRYRLVERLGTGGMSVVWRGFDEILGREVAVKVLSPQLARDAAFRDRLRQEALAAARLCHPHITGIFDFGESPLSERLTVPYVVMELNDGESVGARLRRDGPLPWRDAVSVAVDVASALATAHARGVVHRDVTPANVMLTGSGAKVVDFGISALVGQRDSAPDGSLLGTPAYLAPERLAGGQVSPATDVYALGLLLYRALTARLPWPAETTTEALRAHLYADPEPVPELPGMPVEVALVCLRCLAKDPEDRPGAGEVAHTLAEIIGVQPIIPPIGGAERPAVSVDVDATVPDARPAAVPSAVHVPAPGGPARRVTGNGHGPQDRRARTAARVPARTGGPAITWRRMPSRSPARPGARRAKSSSPAEPSGPPARGGRPVRAALRVLRLRAGLRIGAALRLGVARPLGGGLFAGGRLRRRAFGTGLGLAADGRGGRGTGHWAAFAARHGLQAVALTLTLLVAVGVAWSAAREPTDVDDNQAAAAGTGTPALTQRRPDCKVRYQVRQDTGTGFEALVTVFNTSDRVLRRWRMSFLYPGSQRIVEAPSTVTQHGRKVVLRAAGGTTLAPRRGVSVILHGAYRETNPLPLAFTVDSSPCRAEVLGVATVAVNTEDSPVTEAAGKGRTAGRGADRGSTGSGAGAGSGAATAPATRSDGGAGSGRTGGRTSMIGTEETPSVPAAGAPSPGPVGGGPLPGVGGRAGPAAGFASSPRLGVLVPDSGTGAAADRGSVEKVKRRPAPAPAHRHPHTGPAGPPAGRGPWISV